MQQMTRRPLFWIAHTLFFLVCLTYTWKNFYRSFPFVELEVKMDRVAALKAADALARVRGWQPLLPRSSATSPPSVGAPINRREAVSFDVDSSTQNFIELEAGGPSALREVLQKGIYTPYTWHVRHFAEGVTGETHIRFRPDGTAESFSEHLSETEPGAALGEAAARAIAEKSAHEEWGVDLKPYHLAEKSAETRKSKRVDHEFIYERDELIGTKAGEGKYRLRLEVSGDRLTELSRYIKVPEAFRRRYATMRSANGTISTLAGAVIVILYGLGLCGFGLFTLARGRWVQWRTAVAVAAVISVLHFLDQLNRFPLEWMGYDTAISTRAFALKHAASALLASVFDFVAVVIPLIAAETMSRKAFPGQPQLWRVFSREATVTRPIAGRVIGAYLAVGFHFAWVVWIYRVGAQQLGWWNPSELLFHPDELATYFPWLSSVANSLHAGVWEECLFRAVPLAGAALLGDRYGKRGAWIAAAFVLQAVIFGAAHASYPTQPSYARLIELLVPSTVFGGVYLAFGLLPGILMHYTYDVVLFAMPLFLSSGTSAIVNRVFVVAVSLLPLWLILAARVRKGAWAEMTDTLRNRGWKPAELNEAIADAAVKAHAVLRHAPKRMSITQRRGLAASGGVALVVWAGLGSFHSDAPAIKISKEEAISIARTALMKQGVPLGSEWQALASVDGTPGEEEDFIWRTSGVTKYQELLTRYLDPPQWKVRFARFEGDLVERAEERQVFILGNGEIQRIRHELPESRKGATLDEAAAKVLAIRALAMYFAQPVSSLTDVSSNQFQLPGRRDWVFTWSDPMAGLKLGEARIAVKVAGDEVVGYRRYVYVPEAWLRAERSRKTELGVPRMVAMAFLALLVLWISFQAFLGWVQGRFNRRVFWFAFGALAFTAAALRLNEFSESVAQFTTAQPWSSQVLRTVISDLLMALVGSAISALCVGRVHAKDSSIYTGHERGPWLGYAAAAWLAAASAGGAWVARAEHPIWASVGALGASIPWLESLQGVATYFGGTAFLLLLFPWVESWVEARNPHARRWRRVCFIAALGYAAGAMMAQSSLLEWLGMGALASVAIYAVFELVARTSVSILIPFVAGVAILRAARTVVVHPYPGAIAHGLLLMIGVAGVSWFWFGWLGSASEPTDLVKPLAISENRNESI